MLANGLLSKWVSFLLAFLFFSFTAMAQTTQSPESSAPRDWIRSGKMDGVKGLGIATYSRFNPQKAWREAFKKGVNDLNANYSLLVHSYGKQVGRGPLRLRADYAIRSFVDTTQVSVVDSVRWKGRAFMLVESTEALSDSVLYPSGNFSSVIDSSDSTGTFNKSGIWLHTTGSTQRIDSNWFYSLTKAKQDAVRQLAEDLAVKISTETYTKNQTSRRYLNFSTMFAFQRIHVVKRIFQPDSIKVQLAIKPHHVKELIDD